MTDRPASDSDSAPAKGGDGETASLRRRFVELVHHELKTPLTSILAASRLLQAESAVADNRQCVPLLEILTRNTSRLERLIENLLDLQRIVLDEMSYDLEQFELQPLLQEIAAEREVDETPTRHQIRVGSFGALAVVADRAKLKRVLEEIFDCADRLSWPGSQLGLDPEIRDSEVLLHVASEGGRRVTEDNEEQFFGAFRASPDSNKLGEDAGISQLLMRRLMEGMRGALLVAENPIEEARITLRLPSELTDDTYDTHELLSEHLTGEDP